MTQNTGLHGSWRGECRLQLEIVDKYDKIKYRYMILSESQVKGSRVDTLTEPCVLLNSVAEPLSIFMLTAALFMPKMFSVLEVKVYRWVLRCMFRIRAIQHH